MGDRVIISAGRRVGGGGPFEFNQLCCSEKFVGRRLLHMLLASRRLGGSSINQGIKAVPLFCPLPLDGGGPAWA
jgi:hypothetical protein